MNRLTESQDTIGGTAILDNPTRWMTVFLCALMLMPFDLFTVMAYPSSQAPINPAAADSTVYLDADVLVKVPGEYAYDEAADEAADSIPTVVVDEHSPYGLDGKKIFNPSPERAVWLSALFPGLGQVYNRRYWKLPIVVGGFMGIGYATSWNNSQLQDYTQAYRDIMDNDPSTNSYMNFFPPTTTEDSLDKSWLSNTLKSRRDFYRRNRDLCIILLVGMYLLCMVDAYVDASLAHFDVSPDLSIDWSPNVMVDPSDRKLSVGLSWAFNF